MEYTKDISPGQKAYTKFEIGYFTNAMAIGDLEHGVFDVERIRIIMHDLEESTFEAIEAGCFSEIEGLKQLFQELVSNSSALRHHRIDGLADEVDQRIQAVQSRLETLIAEQYADEPRHLTAL